MPAPDPGLEPPDFDFHVQVLRPGQAYEPLTVELPAQLALSVAAAAAADSYPLEPWLALVIESERALASIERPEGLPADLDAIATEQADPLLHRSSRSRLLAYAAAIRELGRNRTAPPTRHAGAPPRKLDLPIPYNANVSWARAASHDGLSVSEWALVCLEELDVLPTGRPLWEAAAAERGLTLAEWIYLYAVSSSSPDSNAASASAHRRA